MVRADIVAASCSGVVPSTRPATSTIFRKLGDDTWPSWISYSITFPEIGGVGVISAPGPRICFT